VREGAITGLLTTREEMITVVILGLILLAAAGVLTAAVVTSNTGAVDTDLWNLTISNLSLGIVFVAGMLTTVVGVAGVVLLTAGVRRGQRLRQERRVLRRENQRLTRRVDTTTSDEDVAAAPADSQATESHRRNLFTPRRPLASEPPTDAEGRHAEARDRVVASDTSAEPTSRSS
jgi:hypothetical protein